MRNNLKNIIAASLFVGLAATAVKFENAGPTENDCQTYQGWRTSPEGKIFYVFDSLSVDERTISPEHHLEGDPSLKDGLLSYNSIGDRFCFTYTDPISPTGYKVLKSIVRESRSQQTVEEE